MAALGLAALTALGASACGPAVDFKQALQITDLSGGWYDYGIVDGKNKLVPLLRFRIRKQPDVQLRGVDVNIHFKQIAPDKPQSKDAEVELAEVFLQKVEFTEGDQTALLTVHAENGFTGDAPQTRAEMLAHRLFQDVRARVFAKQSSTTWVEVATFDIPRLLITK
jgi:hypothetical protein